MSFLTDKIPGLRDYQQEAVERLVPALRAHKKVVAVAPTGAGKTVIAAELVRHLGTARILWVAHRIELVQQAAAHLERAGIPREQLGVLTSDKKHQLTARVLVASVAQFWKREVPRADIIVVDEAHRSLAASYKRLTNANPDAYLLGLTATPWRLDGGGLGDVFRNMQVLAEPSSLIAGGHILPLTVFGISRKEARELVFGIRRVRGDFDASGIQRAVMKSTLIGNVVSECGRLAPGAPTLVFAATRRHALALCERFSERGRRAAYLDGETTGPQRASMVAGLATGAVEVIVNVDVLSEGFDCPPIGCIAMARPTRSLTRFLQQVGRATRPYKEKRPVVIDHAGNAWRFGLPDEDRRWSLNGQARRVKGAAPVFRCDCGAMLHIGVTECFSCGVKHKSVRATLPEEHEAELVQLQRTERQLKEIRERLEMLAEARKLSTQWVEQAMELLRAS